MKRIKLTKKNQNILTLIGIVIFTGTFLSAIFLGPEPTAFILAIIILILVIMRCFI